MSNDIPVNPQHAAVFDVRDANGGDAQRMKVWSSRGRLGRLRFLAYGMVAQIVHVLVLMAISLLVGLTAGRSIEIEGSMLLVSYLLLTAFITIRRSHDMGWSGWMSLLAFVPLVGLIWVFKAGNPGANAYGPPPPPNTFGIKFAVFGLIAVFFIGGILAAIAIPAYQQYVKRAQAAQIGK